MTTSRKKSVEKTIYRTVLRTLACLITISLLCSIVHRPLYAYADNGSTNIDVIAEQHSPIRQVALGYGHSAVLLENGSLWTFGANNCGQIGNGSNDNASRPYNVLNDVDSVACGSQFTAAVKRDGTLWVWGDNGNGNLGTGDTAALKVPTQVLEEVDMVSCGHDFMLILMQDHQLRACGRNAWAVYGNGTTTSSMTPVSVREGIVDVSCGLDHVGAVTTDGKLLMWGRNSFGQVGNGECSGNVSVPYCAINGGVKQISMGGYHSAAVTEGNALYAWGLNTYGQVGDNTTSNVSKPKQIMESIKSVALGGWHSSAVGLDGTLYTWGCNNGASGIGIMGGNCHGCIGDGTITHRNTPQELQHDVVMTSLGHTHCAAVQKDGSLIMWGEGTSGQLGDGACSSYLEPTKVSTGTALPDIDPTESDKYIIERVRSYTTGDFADDYLNTYYNSLNLSDYDRFQQIYEFFTRKGYLNPSDGFAFLKNTSHERWSYQGIVTNECFLSFQYDWWLTNTLEGGRAKGSLITADLIFNNSYTTFLNPVALARHETPSIKAYEALLYDFMDRSQTEIEKSNLIALTKDVVSKTNGAAEAHADYLIARLNEANTIDELQGLVKSNEMKGVFDACKDGRLKLSMDRGFGKYLAKWKPAAKAVSFSISTLEDLQDVFEFDSKLEVYQTFDGFLAEIINASDVPDDLRAAAVIVRDELNEGTYGQIVEFAENLCNNAAEQLNVGMVSVTRNLFKTVIADTFGVAAASSFCSWLAGEQVSAWAINLLTGVGGLVDSAHLVEGYQKLCAHYRTSLLEDAARFREDANAKNAWKFYEDYNMLWQLRVKAEKAYYDMYDIDALAGVVLEFGAKQKQRDAVNASLRMLNECSFIIDDNVRIPDSADFAKYSSKMKLVIDCPVDVDVYAPDGTLVTTMHDGAESEVKNDNGLFVVTYRPWTGEWAKVAFVNSTGYRFVARANDKGLVTATLIDNEAKSTINMLENFMVEEGDGIQAEIEPDPLTGALLVCAADQDGDGQFETNVSTRMENDSRIAVTEIALSKEQIDVRVGEDALLGVATTPTDATCQQVFWISLDEDVATVRNGKVTGAGIGETTVLCVSQDNTDIVARCTINVSAARVNLSGAEISGFDNLVYNTSVQPVNPTVKVGENTLRTGIDYTVTGDTTVETAGNYSITFCGVGDYIGEKKVNFTVSPKVVDGAMVICSPSSFEYDGTAKVPEIVVKDGDIVIPASEYDVSLSDNVNAGEVPVTVTDNEGGNYTVSGVGSFVITGIPITPIVTIDGWKYGESSKSPVVSGNDGVAVVKFTYKEKDANDDAYSAYVPTDAGDYTVRATVPAIGNYAGGSAEADFTIAKAQSIIAVRPKAVGDLEFTGSAQALVTQGLSVGGMVEYSLDGTAWSDDIPTETNAGTYSVWYRVAGDKNHEDMQQEGPIQVDIIKSLDPAVITTSATVVRGGKECDLSGLVSDAEGEVSFAISGDALGCMVDSANGILVSGDEQGDVIVIATVAESSNRVGKSQEIVVHVTEKASTAIGVVQPSVTYGTVLGIPSTNPTAPEDGMRVTYTGMTRAGVAYGPSEEPPIDAGAYAVVVSWETDDAIYSGSVAFSIDPASIDYAVVELGNELTYNGTAQTQNVKSVILGETNITSQCSVTGNVATETGEHTLTITANDNGNYAGKVRKAYRVTCADISMADVEIDDRIIYTGNELRPSCRLRFRNILLSEGIDYVLSYANNVNVGTATVVITGVGNFKGSKSAQFAIVEPDIVPQISYRTHVQRKGWQKYVTDGAMSGTSGKSLRLEGINIRLSNLPYSGGIQYRTHVQRIGWQGWRKNNAMAGTKGKSLRLEAIQIKLYGELAKHYDVYYRVHAQRFGWMGWAKNGAQSGTAGYSYRLEGIQVVLVRKGAAPPGRTLKGITQRVAVPFKQKAKH